MKIKICGLKRKQDAIYANEAHPDFAGVILADGFRRSIDLNQAKIIREELDDDIPLVGVFVNDEITKIKKAADEHIIQLIQLHGAEDELYLQKVKKIGLPVIKAIHLEDDTSPFALADYYLLDNVKPGSGQTFDWTKIKKLDKPFFLAGGINLDNIDEAKQIQAYGLDVSSGVETNGYKDEYKMNEIVRRVRHD